ncbi:MAG: peptidylprolyl isomerase, partial [Candidatus Coproplasma sp.]
MKLKNLGRILCAVAIAGTVITLPFVSGCNTDHPEAQITISYNDADYVLEYKMYRNMYPQTVQHFIELADNGFYNNMIVHNYQSSYWFTGGYSYDADSYAEAVAGDENDRLDYYEAVSKEYEYSQLADPDNGKITPSVYEDYIGGQYVKPLNTLIGEFSNNQHKIDNGALTNGFGNLSMYYTSKNVGKVENQNVWLNKTGSQPGVKGTYNYNSATSIFRIQTGTSTSS